MKPLHLALILFAAATALVAVPDTVTEPKKMALPRLTQVDAFPEKYRVAVRAIGAALSAAGGKPSEYFAEFSVEKNGIWEFYLKHKSHPVNDSGWCGDACGRCRIAFYDSKAGKFLKFQGIR